MSGKKTRPEQVRAELRKRGLSYSVIKEGTSWYVCGGNTSEWYDTCLYIWTFDGQPAQFWAGIIQEMAGGDRR